MSTRVYVSRSEVPREARPREFERRNPDRSTSIMADLGAWSRKGASRLLNEDYFTSATLALSRRRAGGPLFLAVAGGLGGEEAGEQASRLASQSMVDLLGAVSAAGIEREAEELLKDALMAAHLEILEEGKANPERFGMGTTLTAALVLWPRVHLIHAGDSRAYHFRKGRLTRLTTDHTLEQQLRDQGRFLPPSIDPKRYRNVVWNHLGGDPELPQPELTAADLEAGDGLLLTTDGLTDVLPDLYLEESIARWGSAETVSRGLVGEVRNRDGRDDATALYARFGTATGFPQDASGPRP